MFQCPQKLLFSDKSVNKEENEQLRASDVDN